jgi:hypothetical protein
MTPDEWLDRTHTPEYKKWFWGEVKFLIKIIFIVGIFLAFLKWGGMIR